MIKKKSKKAFQVYRLGARRKTKIYKIQKNLPDPLPCLSLESGETPPEATNNIQTLPLRGQRAPTSSLPLKAHDTKTRLLLVEVETNGQLDRVRGLPPSAPPPPPWYTHTATMTYQAHTHIPGIKWRNQQNDNHKKKRKRKHNRHAGGRMNKANALRDTGWYRTAIFIHLCFDARRTPWPSDGYKNLSPSHVLIMICTKLFSPKPPEHVDELMWTPPVLRYSNSSNRCDGVTVTVTTKP